MGKEKDAIRVHEEKLEEYEEELPPEYEPRTPQHFPVVNKMLSSGLIVYPSEESKRNYKDYKKQTNSSHVLSEHANGRAMPLLEAAPQMLSSTFTLKRFIIPKASPNGELVPFDIKTHYYDQCVIKKKSGFECSVYTLKFLEEEVRVFYHNVVPIIDYEYDGAVYRWVNQKINSLGKFKYILYKLGPNRGYSIVDSWDKTAKKLISNHPSMKASVALSISARRKKPELYKDAVAIGDICDTKSLGSNGTVISLENDFSTDYDSINSVSPKMLVHLVVGLIIKRYKDVEDSAVIAAIS